MTWFSCALVVCAPVWAQDPQAAGEPPRFQLVVLRGDDAQNNIKKGRATKAVVEVRDRNNKPVAGLAVLFLLPGSGPGGTFVGGTQTASVTTDSAGQASITYKPNNVSGKFNLKATVRSGSTETSVNIPQTNLVLAAAGLSTTAIVILAVVGAGVGVGLGVGLTRGGGSSPSGITLTPGGATVGPPK
jgi:hypothetical protein